MSTLPEWNPESYALLAGHLRGLVETLGHEHDYREDKEWIAARIDASESLKTLLMEQPQIVGGAIAVTLVRRTMAHINGQEPDPDQFQDVLVSLSEHFASADAVLFHYVQDSLARADDPEEDQMPLLQDLVTFWEPLTVLTSRRISLTGDFALGTRQMVVDRLAAKGASWVEYPANGAELLVIGTFGAAPSGHVYVSRKMRQVLEGEAPNVRIVHESQLLPAL